MNKKTRNLIINILTGTVVAILGILFLAGTYLVIDFIGFMAWIMSEQFPVDGFYLGKVTVETIKFFTSL